MKVNNVLYILMFFLLCSFTNCKKEPVKPNGSGAVIQTIEPLMALPGTTITITGNNFSTNPSLNKVSIGSVMVEPAEATATALKIVVPKGLEPGSYAIGVKVNGIVTGYKDKLIIIQEAIPNFTSTDKVPVTADIVNKCFFSYGKLNVHPRLIFTAADIARVKTVRTSDAVANASYADIIVQADKILTMPLLNYGLDGAGLRIPSIHTFANDHVPYLILAYQFTGETKYAQRCWQQVENMLSWPDWGAARHFLDTGIGAKGIAMVYDGLYSYLSPDQRTKIVNALRKFALEPGKTQIETGTGAWKWYQSNNNWNGICHGGLIMAALAIYESDPAFCSKVIQLAANGIVPYLQSLEPDGASPEGMMYWSYGLSNTFLAFESMKNVLSTTFGLAERPGFKKTPSFPYRVSGPAGTATMGDDYLYYGAANRFLSFFWYAHHFNDADFARTHYEICLARNANKSVKLNGWIDLLFYKPELVSQGNAASFPLNNYVAGADYMYLRENNTDPNSLYVAMHGGDNNASHGHLDAGTFFIQALGENFAVGNLGKEDPYPQDIFTVTSPAYTDAPINMAKTPGRFYYYRIRTEGKSCLVFNPDARPEQNPVGKAIMKKEANDNAGGFYTLNLTDCYSRDVSSYSRGIKLNRNSGVITVQDEFVPLRNSTVYWIMHSPATDGLAISSDGKTATMTKNGKVFHAIIKSPEGATFEKTDRSETSVNYLSETAPIFGSVMSGKNGLNKWYGKLQIKLADVSKEEMTKIRIDFSSNKSVITTDLILMDYWTTTN